MKNYVVKYAQLGLFAGLLIALDQWTKTLVMSHLTLGETWMPLEWLQPFARIVHWANTGVAFGMFQGKGLFFTIIAILVSLAIIYFYPRVPNNEWYLRLALALQLAGALGNMIDRIRVGYVIDFISVGDFPVFNVADSCITVGVVVLILGVWWQDRNDKRMAQTPAAEELSAPVEAESNQHG